MNLAFGTELAIARALELVKGGKTSHAIEQLLRLLSLSRGKQSDLEEAVRLLVRLTISCMDLKSLRDGLHQYRTIALHSNNNASLGRIVRFATAQTREKLRRELRSEEEAPLPALERVPGTKGRVIGEDLTDRGETRCTGAATASAQKENLALLRFTWEVFKAVLDLLRLNVGAERDYHSTVAEGCAHLVQHERRNEMRRLNDLLRGHYLSLGKAHLSKHQKNAASRARDVERLLLPYLHINTRLNQMQASIKLQLWKDAGLIALDIVQLGLPKMAKAALESVRAPAPDAKPQKALQVLLWQARYLACMGAYTAQMGAHHWHSYALLLRLQIVQVIAEQDASGLVQLGLLEAPAEVPGAVAGTPPPPPTPEALATLMSQLSNECALACLSAPQEQPPVRHGLRGVHGNVLAKAVTVPTEWGPAARRAILSRPLGEAAPGDDLGTLLGGARPAYGELVNALVTRGIADACAPAVQRLLVLVALEGTPTGGLDEEVAALAGPYRRGLEVKLLRLALRRLRRTYTSVPLAQLPRKSLLEEADVSIDDEAGIVHMHGGLQLSEDPISAYLANARSALALADHALGGSARTTATAGTQQVWAAELTKLAQFLSVRNNESVQRRLVRLKQKEARELQRKQKEQAQKTEEQLLAARQQQMALKQREVQRQETERARAVASAAADLIKEVQGVFGQHVTFSKPNVPAEQQLSAEPAGAPYVRLGMPVAALPNTVSQFSVAGKGRDELTPAAFADGALEPAQVVEALQKWLATSLAEYRRVKKLEKKRLWHMAQALKDSAIATLPSVKPPTVDAEPESCKQKAHALLQHLDESKKRFFAR